MADKRKKVKDGLKAGQTMVKNAYGEYAPRVMQSAMDAGAKAKNAVNETVSNVKKRKRVRGLQKDLGLGEKYGQQAKPLNPDDKGRGQQQKDAKFSTSKDESTSTDKEKPKNKIKQAGANVINKTSSGAKKLGMKAGNLYAKAGLPLAAAATVGNAALNPQEFAERSQKLTMDGADAPWYKRLAAGAATGVADYGNAATLGLAGKAGEMIANKINGDGWATNSGLNTTQQPQPQQPAQSNAERIMNEQLASAEQGPQELVNPNGSTTTSVDYPSTNVSDAGIVSRVGPNAGLAYGRSPENQQQIDNNVARINQETQLMSELREARSGEGRGLSPEQQQAMSLARQMRSGNIGDKQRNRALSSQIDAILGVDQARNADSQISANRENAQLDLQGRLSKAQYEAAQKQMDNKQAWQAENAELLTSGNVDQVNSRLAIKIAEQGYLDKGDMSALMQGANMERDAGFLNWVAESLGLQGSNFNVINPNLQLDETMFDEIYDESTGTYGMVSSSTGGQVVRGLSASQR